MKNVIIFILILLGTVSIISFVLAEEFKYDFQDLRDPFFPLVDNAGRIVSFEPKSGISEIYLEGIVYDPTASSAAIINGEIYKAHDFIDVYELIEIKQDLIILLKDGQKIEIKLEKEAK